MMLGRDPPLIWQLDDPARVVRMPPSGHVRHSTWSDDTDDAELRCPLFLGRAVDPEVEALQVCLQALGIPTARVAADDVHIGVSATVDGIRFSIGDRTVVPTVTWVRHFSARSRPSVTLVADRFRDDSWEALLRQLDHVTAGRMLGVSVGMLRQLAAARDCGVRVPRTIVTTRPAVDAAAIGGERLVLKALGGHFVEGGPGALSGVFAQVVRRRDAASWAAVPVPVVLQEYVEHEAELRVYYMDGAVYAFQVVKDSPEAPWLDERAVVITACPVSDRVAAAATMVAARLDITYAAFDFLIRAGEPVFLEANASGDWRWFEARSGSRVITTAVTGMIANLHRAGATAHGGAFRRAQRLPLALFLAG